GGARDLLVEGAHPQPEQERADDGEDENKGDRDTDEASQPQRSSPALGGALPPGEVDGAYRRAPRGEAGLRPFPIPPCGCPDPPCTGRLGGVRARTSEHRGEG